MIIVASDKFKGTYPAGDICRIIADRFSAAGEEILVMPMADGGEGTASILGAIDGMSLIKIDGYNPFGGKMEWELYTDETKAALDSAAIVGRVATRDILAPMSATSFYLGRLVGSLIAAGKREIWIGVGGTMTTDGGCGFLQGLGWEMIDYNGKLIDSPMTPANLIEIHKIIPHPLPSGIKLFGLMDVDVPMLPDTNRPERLSALSFAHQKGVKDAEISLLAYDLEHFVNLADDAVKELGCHYPSHYCGAGGGLGFALQVAGGTALQGANYIWQNYLHTSHIPDSEISRIYTGEGCFDAQSLRGKVTGMLIDYGHKHDIPVTVICGRNTFTGELPDNVEIITLHNFLHNNV